jgi:hypothetical protein
MHMHAPTPHRTPHRRFIKNNLLVELAADPAAMHRPLSAWILRRHNLISYMLYMIGMNGCDFVNDPTIFNTVRLSQLAAFRPISATRYLPPSPTPNRHQPTDTNWHQPTNQPNPSGFVSFVLSLKRGMYMYQFGQYAWTHMVLLIIFVPSSFFVSNVFEGLIWFLLPSALIIVNDIMAYLAGGVGGCRGGRSGRLVWVAEQDEQPVQSPT